MDDVNEMERRRGRGLGRFARALSVSVSERQADNVVHILGVSGSLMMGTLLLSWANQVLPEEYYLPLAVYVAGMIGTFVFSAAYNMSNIPGVNHWLRRFDHAAIFTMIAGTYTPICVISIGGVWGYGLLAAVWTLAVIGVYLKLFKIDQCERYSLPLYLGMGWLIVLAAEQMYSALPTEALHLIVGGGVIYTAGVVFFVWDRLKYNQAIWHIFVLVAACVHFAGILWIVDLPSWVL